MAGTVRQAASLYEEYTGDKVPVGCEGYQFSRKLREAFPEIENWGTMVAYNVYPTLKRVIEARASRQRA